jgi:hypothetical protein
MLWGTAINMQRNVTYVFGEKCNEKTKRAWGGGRVLCLWEYPGSISSPFSDLEKPLHRFYYLNMPQ